MRCFNDFLESMGDIALISEAAEEGQLSKDDRDRARGNALARSGYVLLCGYFEGFLRELIAEFIEGINDAKVKVGMLPDSLLYSALSDVLCQYGPKDAISHLKTSILEDTHLSVNARKHSKTGGNPTVDTVEALFAAIGFPDVIDALSIQDFGVASTFISESQVGAQMKASIESALEAGLQPSPEAMVAAIVKIIDEKWSPKKKRRKVGYVSEIEELLKRRNRIAHGEGREPIAVEDLKAAAESITRLSKGLHNLLSEQLKAVLPN